MNELKQEETIESMNRIENLKELHTVTEEFDEKASLIESARAEGFILDRKRTIEQGLGPRVVSDSIIKARKVSERAGYVGVVGTEQLGLEIERL